MFCSISEHFNYTREYHTNVSRKAELNHDLYPGGEQNSLTVKLHKSGTSIFDICWHNSFIVHSPFEHPLSYKDYEFCEFGYGMELDVLITPEVIVSDEYLKRYTKEARHCVFNVGEVDMSYYKVYSQKNCEMECLASRAIEECGCVPYYFVTDGNTPVCSINETKCVRYWEFWNIQRDERFGTEILCNCLPSCDSVKYNIEVIPKKLSNVSSNEIVIRFKFKDSEYTPLRRYQQFTFIDFVSQSGGILGLFAGVSLLTVVELFYLLFIRGISNVMRIMTMK